MLLRTILLLLLFTLYCIKSSLHAEHRREIPSFLHTLAETVRPLVEVDYKSNIYCVLQKNDSIRVLHMQSARDRPCLHLQRDRPYLHLQRARDRPCLHLQSVRDKPCLHLQSARFRPCLHLQRARDRPCLHLQSVRDKPCLHLQSARFRPCLHLQRARDRPCLHLQSARFRPCLHLQSVRDKPCLHLQSVRNKPCLSVQSVTDISCLLMQCAKNLCSLKRNLYSDYHMLEYHKKGNFTSSYLQIWKCSKLCSFDKPVDHISKEIHARNISAIYHLYSIVYFTHSASVYNICIRIYLSIRRHFIYKHDFKELQKKIIVDIKPYKEIKYRKIYTATFPSLSSQNDDSTSFMPADQYGETEEISCSSLPVSSGPGGGPANVFSRDKLEQYMLNPSEFKNIHSFTFVEHMTSSAAKEKLKTNHSLLQCQIPISKLVSSNMLLSVIRSLCREHNINLISRASKADWISACSSHHCNLCDNQITTFSVFTSVKSNTEINKAMKRKTSEFFKTKKRKVNKTAYNKRKLFPPSLLSTNILETIANDFCKSMSIDVFSESGCTVCCILTRNTDLMSLTDFTSSCKKKNILDVLIPEYSGTAVIERH